MADDTATPQATPPAGEPVTTTPAPTTTPAQAATTTPTPEPPAGDGTEHISLEEARKLRSEAANLRKRMKAFEDAEQAARDAQLSEIDRTKKQHAEVQSQYETYKRATQERIVRYEVAMRAQALGIIHPDAAAKLLDWSELEYDEDGTPKNADKLLEKLLKQMPYLARPAVDPTPATPTPPASPSAAMAHAPTLPAMNPGRSTIAPPDARTPGVKPSWSDVYKRP